MRVPPALSTAALCVAAGVALAAPAAAAERPAPHAGVEALRVVCSGDTLRTSAVVPSDRAAGPITVTLLARTARGPFTATGRSLTLTPAKSGRTTWPLDVAGLPAGTTRLRVVVTSRGGVVQTRELASARCAPGTEVPEVPAAALLPLTLAATAGGVLAVRSRSAAGPVTR